MGAGGKGRRLKATGPRRDQGQELRVERGHGDVMPSDSATWPTLQSEKGPSVFTAVASSPQKSALASFFLRSLS